MRLGSPPRPRHRLQFHLAASLDAIRDRSSALITASIATRAMLSYVELVQEVQNPHAGASGGGRSERRGSRASAAAAGVERRRVYVRACMRACVRACVRVWACACACVRACMHVRQWERWMLWVDGGGHGAGFSTPARCGVEWRGEGPQSGVSRPSRRSAHFGPRQCANRALFRVSLVRARKNY